ncbi:macrodontain-1-like [Chenopodium quinoa]|uniref:macrodontain-1-like n=1 Tax=Chenopodium quinoa TaxID=63459 RepID=UPI000B798B19|nr:macrodontain-1-like [Chenopodium quinoa]
MAFSNHYHFHSISFVILALGFWASQASARPLDLHKALLIRKRHEQWMTQHGRVYKDEIEKEKRFNIFKKNIEYIENFNGNNASSNKMFTLGVNAFTDLTTEEFIATHTGYKRQFHSISNGSMTMEFSYENLTDYDISPSVDWREQGAVTGIKYQGQCEGCWAFSVVAAVEGLNRIKFGQLISLSEEELIDCVQEDGCRGGDVSKAYTFTQQNQGITTEGEYPYTAYYGYQGQCQAWNAGGNTVTINGYQNVPQNDEISLMQAVSRQPVSAGIDASSADFKSYSGGIYYNQMCGTSYYDLNHAVTIIGYGYDDTYGTNYWLIKNSWGESWGENGYMRIIKDQNQCGISMAASYPI